MKFNKYFPLWLEAKRQDVSALTSHIADISRRPFNEMFGNRDRFLIKIENPEFTNIKEHLGLDDEIDVTTRKIQGINWNTWIKNKRQFANNLMKKGTQIQIDHMYAIVPILDGNSDVVWFILDNNNRKLGFDKNLDIDRVNDMVQRGILIKTDRPYEGWLVRGEIPGDIYDIQNTDAFKDELKRLDVQWQDSIITTANSIKHCTGKLKQILDQNNIFYYLLFSRHPIDVLRMSDHKGISSCHRLDGSYGDCARADAKNDGGIVYLLRGRDARAVQNNINDDDIFEDSDRNIHGVRPIGRIRLRRFIDLQTEKDFAVPTSLMDEQKYGYITKNIWKTILNYCQEKQQIFKHPPTNQYAKQNIVMLGGTYSDESLSQLLNIFFNSHKYQDITHKHQSVVYWEEELYNIAHQHYELFKEFSLTKSIGPNEYGQRRVFIKGLWGIPLQLNGSTLDIDNKTVTYIDVGRILDMTYQYLKRQVYANIENMNTIDEPPFIKNNNIMIPFVMVFADPDYITGAIYAEVFAYLNNNLRSGIWSYIETRSPVYKKDSQDIDGIVDEYDNRETTRE